VLLALASSRRGSPALNQVLANSLAIVAALPMMGGSHRREGAYIFLLNF